MFFFFFGGKGGGDSVVLLESGLGPKVGFDYGNTVGGLACVGACTIGGRGL